MIEKILKKQKTKIENDQEIETLEDDLIEINKTIESKQAYNDELGVRIAIRKRELQAQKEQSQGLKKVKSSPGLLQILFG